MDTKQVLDQKIKSAMGVPGTELVGVATHALVHVMVDIRDLLVDGVQTLKEIKKELHDIDHTIHSK